MSKAKEIKEQFYEDSSSASSTSGISGTSYGRRRQRRKRVKSGADIKQRPVIRTEVWPHTIANEDDGEDVTSEDICLSKFLSCFTYLMISCDETKAEAAGRAVLLHAVTTVLECLPWREARIFHNLMMVKIEQGRLDWDSDFTSLANQYLDKKVRMCLRSSHSGNNFDYSNSKRSHTKNFGNNVFDNKNNATSVICRLWNGGFCSFGANCKRWHVCLSCAESGKLGEPHQASSHFESSARNSEPEQCF